MQTLHDERDLQAKPKRKRWKPGKTWSARRVHMRKSMKKSTRRLQLRTETVALLSDSFLSQAQGGMGAYCRTYGAVTCKQQETTSTCLDGNCPSNIVG